MASGYIEEESSLEEPMEFSSIRSSIIHSIRSHEIITFDSEDFRTKLTDMLVTVNYTVERIEEVVTCCRWSYYSEQITDIEMTLPLQIRDELIEIRGIIKQGLVYLEELYKCSSEVYSMIGHLIMYEIEMPVLDDFDVPRGSLIESVSRIISVTAVENFVGALTSKHCLINLINLATNHVMIMRTYKRRVTHLFDQCIRSLSSEIIQVKDDIENCIGKIIDFGRALEYSQVKARLRSANTMLEVANYNNQNEGLFVIKTIFEAHRNFQISFQNFRLEIFNQGKSLDEIWRDVECNSLTTGLIHPIVSILNCSPQIAWRILRLLESKRSGRYECISYEPAPDTQLNSITSDPGLD